MIIRKAQEKDLEQILDIFNYEIINTQYVYIHEPWTMEYILTWFREKQESNFPFLVAESESHVVGYAYYGTFRGREAYKSTVEYSIYIHRDHRQKGIARQLFSTLIEIAKENGIRTVIGGTDAGNKKSIDFHNRLGFTQVAHIKSVAYKFDKWLDLLLFQLLLTDEGSPENE